MQKIKKKNFIISVTNFVQRNKILLLKKNYCNHTEGLVPSLPHARGAQGRTFVQTLFNAAAATPFLTIKLMPKRQSKQEVQSFLKNCLVHATTVPVLEVSAGPYEIQEVQPDAKACAFSHFFFFIQVF